MANERIIICNLRFEHPEFEYDIKVDRSSVFGNPFKFNVRSWAGRENSCNNYEKYFLNRVANDFNFSEEIYLLKYRFYKYKHLRLFCWCAPLRCHAETIREYLLTHYKE